MTGTSPARCPVVTCCAHALDDHEERPEQRRLHGNIEVITAPLNICYRCYDEYFEGKDEAPWWSFLWVLAKRAVDGRPPLWYRHRPVHGTPEPSPEHEVKS